MGTKQGKLNSNQKPYTQGQLKIDFQQYKNNNPGHLNYPDWKTQNQTQDQGIEDYMNKKFGTLTKASHFGADNIVDFEYWVRRRFEDSIFPIGKRNSNKEMEDVRNMVCQRLDISEPELQNYYRLFAQEIATTDEIPKAGTFFGDIARLTYCIRKEGVHTTSQECQEILIRLQQQLPAVRLCYGALEPKKTFLKPKQCDISDIVKSLSMEEWNAFQKQCSQLGITGVTKDRLTENLKMLDNKNIFEPRYNPMIQEGVTIGSISLCVMLARCCCKCCPSVASYLNRTICCKATKELLQCCGEISVNTATKTAECCQEVYKKCCGYLRPTSANPERSQEMVSIQSEDKSFTKFLEEDKEKSRGTKRVQHKR